MEGSLQIAEKYKFYFNVILHGVVQSHAHSILVCILLGLKT